MEISKKKAKEDIDYFNKKLTPHFRLRPDQLQIIQNLGQKNIIAAGRRYGKTAILADHALHKAITMPNSRIGIFAPSWDELEIVFETINLIKDGTLIDKSIKKDGDLKFNKKLTNGSKIIGRVGSTLSRGKRGRGYDYTYFTEAAFIPKESMTAIRPSRLDSQTSFELQESTPIGASGHFYETWNNRHYHKFHKQTLDNPNINKQELQHDKTTMTKLEWQQEYEANFLDDKLSAFPKNLIELCMKQKYNEEHHPSPEHTYIMGIDYGRKRDKTIIITGKLIHEKPGMIKIVNTTEITTAPNDEQFWKKTIQTATKIATHYNTKTIIPDETGIGDMPTQELKNTLQHKNPTTKIKGYNATYENKNKFGATMNTLQYYFENRLLKIPQDNELYRQLQTIQFQTQNTRQIYTNKGKSPDRVSALSLLVKAAQYHTTQTPLQSKSKTRQRPNIHETQTTKISQQIQQDTPTSKISQTTLN